MNTKNTGQVALVGVFSALALVLLLFTYIPTATIAMAAIASLCGVPVVVELGRKAGLLHFAAVSILGAFIALTAEGTGLYIAFFGWYTVFKSFIEGKNLTRAAEWIVKISVFAAAISAYGAVWIFLLHMPIPQDFALWMIPAFVALVGVTFVLYDIGLTRVIATYHFRIRPKLRKLFRF